MPLWGMSRGVRAMAESTERSGKTRSRLDEVYIQAKKYTDGTVGEGALRNFAGAIDAAGTTKGVFVTTTSFNTRRQESMWREVRSASF